MATGNPKRGEIWLLNLNPTVGHEQAGERPCLVVSANEMNDGPSGLVIVAPITKVDRAIPSHVKISAKDSGLSFDSFILCEHTRSVSKQRLKRAIGNRATPAVMIAVERVLKILLNLK